MTMLLASRPTQSIVQDTRLATCSTEVAITNASLQSVSTTADEASLHRTLLLQLLPISGKWTQLRETGRLSLLQTLEETSMQALRRQVCLSYGRQACSPSRAHMPAGRPLTASDSVCLAAGPSQTRTWTVLAMMNRCACKSLWTQ